MALIKCRECGKMISEEAGACPQCGKPVEVIQEAPPVEKKKGSGIGVFLILVIIALAGGGYYYYTYHMKDTEKKEILEKINPEQKNEPVILLDGEVPIDEDKYHHITVELEKESKVTIVYSISTEPKVDIFTLNEAQFAIWKNAKNPKNAEIASISELSASDKMKGTLSGSLKPGKYFVVVDNTNYGTCRPPTNTVNDQSRVKIKITVLEKE